MYRKKLELLLTDLQEGRLSIREAVGKLENMPYEDIGFAKIDHHRALRKGVPEVIFCQNKTPEQVAEIISRLDNDGDILATRATPEIAESVLRKFPDLIYNKEARTLSLTRQSQTRKPGIVVCCAGTSDIPVAQEAAVTAETLGNECDCVFDIGVAGLHRLLSNKEKLAQATVVIVVAGMDGALPTVVSGLIDTPVIAVPTSVGYGASFQGLAPLLTMLNACSPGVVVVNIDNGFGAGYFASMINSNV